MNIKRVKITSATLDTYWYKENVGQELYVTSFDMFDNSFKYRVIETGLHDDKKTPRYLEYGDVEVIEEFEGDVIEQTIISIRRHGATNESSD